MAGFLVAAAINALSYFYWSGGWRNLIRPGAVPQAIGFPKEMWRFGVSYGGASIDWSAFLFNNLVALGIGLCFAGGFLWKRNWLGKFVDTIVEEDRSKIVENRWQFTLSGMLIMTAFFAAVAGLARWALGAGPEMLLAIYLFGPTALIITAMLPKGIAWQYRVMLLAPATLLTIAFAVVLGNRINIPFDQVTLGIYICWVPQTVLAAIVQTIGLVIRFRFKEQNADTATNQTDRVDPNAQSNSSKFK